MFWGLETCRFCYCNYSIFCLNHPSFGSRWVSVCLKEIWLNKTQRSDQTEVVIGIEYGDISQRGRRTHGPTTILWFLLGLRITNTWIHSIYNYIWAPVEILYIWVVAIVMVIAFGRFCGNQHIPDPTWSQNHPTSIPKQARKSIEELFCWFQVLRHNVPFILHSFACIFLHVPFMCMHLPFVLHSFPFMFLSFSFLFLSFVFMSFHFPFIFLSCSFQCACISFHLPSICMHAPFILHYFPFISFMSFHFLSKVMELARLWLGQGTKCNKWLSLSCR